MCSRLPARAERPSTLRADLVLFGLTAIWGFSFPAIQFAVADVPPLTFLAARFGLAAAVLALVFRGRAFRTNGRGLLAAAFLGACLAAGSILQTYGLTLTTVARSAFITALYVVIVPLAATAVQRTRLRASSILGTGLATAGLYLLTSPGAGSPNLGDWLTLGCAFAFALHILIVEAVSPHHDPVALNFWQVLVTAALCGVLMASEGGPRYPVTFWSITGLVVCGVLATAVAFALQLWAQRETSATHAAILFTGEPMFATVFAGLLQGNWLDPPGFLGAGLILAAMVVAQIGARH